MPDATLPGRKVGIQTYPNATQEYKKGGRIKAAHGTTRGRENLLEELGRVESEPSNRNRRDEVRRVHHELNKGLRGGGIAKKGKGIEL